MTSHAAVVARGMGKCCVSGAGAVHVDLKARTMTIGGSPGAEGDWISLNGSTGEVFAGRIATQDAELSGDFGKLMALADRYKRLRCAPTPTRPTTPPWRGASAPPASACAAPSTCSSRASASAVREMILADDEAGRRRRWPSCCRCSASDFEGLFRAMDGLPVTIRLLDPPLHEFVPHDEAGQQVMAAADARAAGQDQDARRGPARVQPHARPPRLPPGHHLPRDHRDAGPRHLRGRAERAGRRAVDVPRDHGAAGGHGARVQRPGRVIRARPPTQVFAERGATVDYLWAR
jgi:pyruvate,orthophosphate dikinase